MFILDLHREFRINGMILDEPIRSLFVEYQRHGPSVWPLQPIASPPNSLSVAFLRSSFAVLSTFGRIAAWNMRATTLEWAPAPKIEKFKKISVIFDNISNKLLNFLPFDQNSRLIWRHHWIWLRHRRPHLLLSLPNPIHADTLRLH